MARIAMKKKVNAFSRWFYISDSLRFYQFSKEELKIFELALTEMKVQRQRVEAVAGEARGDFLIFNKEGTKCPIYWCFNNWAEPLMLARKLGPEQPLVAMHSLHSFIPSWREKGRYNDLLAARYLSQVQKSDNFSNVIFGGNCQGGPIAESMAIQQANLGEIWPKLVVLEYTPRKYFQGKVKLIYGDKSKYNPFLSEIDPIPIWESHFKDYQYAIIEGRHGKYFTEPTIDQLVANIC